MARLKSAHGLYLCWDPVANELIANRPEAGAWEEFKIHLHGDGRIAIEAHNGKLLTAESNGKVVARGEHPYAWELWNGVVVDGKLAFRSGNDAAPGFLTAELDGTVVVRSETPDAWQQWTIEGLLIAHKRQPLDPAWGPVKLLNNEVFADNRGPFVPVGVHFGEAFSAFCRGKEHEVEGQLGICVDAGYNFHRTWGNLGYYQGTWNGREVAFTSFRADNGKTVGETRDYYGRWHEYLEMCERVGIRVALDDGDMNSMSRSAIQTHKHRLRAVMDDFPHTIFSASLANEKWQNFPRDHAHDEQLAVDLMKEAFRGSPYLLGNSAPDSNLGNDYHESGKAFADLVRGFFSFGTVHGTREFEDMEKVMRRYFNYGYERYPEHYREKGGKPYAMVSMEPGGSGSGVTVGRTDDVWKIVGMHIATLIGRTATVYMSGHGVFWNGPIHEQPGFAEVGRLTSIFPSNAFTFNALHGNRPDAWFTSEGGFADQGRGYGRVDQLVSDSNRFGLCIAHSGKGFRRLVTRRNVEVSVMGLDLKPKFTDRFRMGQSFDVGGDAFLTATLV